MLILLILAALAGGMTTLYYLSSYSASVAMLLSPFVGSLIALIAAMWIVVRDLAKGASAEDEIQQALKRERQHAPEERRRSPRLRDKLLSPFQ